MQKSKPEFATFAAGCFWGVEEALRNAKGVLSTEVGYTGGHTESPTYDDVCSDTTGHAEAVRVGFDPKKIKYGDLLEIFWNKHDPTSYHRQGPDVGSQYRSAIFYHNEGQKKAALKSKKQLENSGKYKNNIVTEIMPAGKFYKAEEHHQKYLQKHPIFRCF